MNNTVQPLYIKVDENDNVAIVVNGGGLKKGAVFSCGLELADDIPQGHKTALTDIAEGHPITRYGETIGYALRDIKKGQWIDESIVKEPGLPGLDELPAAGGNPAPLPRLEGYTFEGYRNADGSAGTKNILCITTSVQCVTGVINNAVKIIQETILPKYPNVDGVMAFNHGYGCGVAIDAPDAAIPIRTIRNIAKNPNLGGQLMVVGLGCEKLPPDRLMPDIDKQDVLILQDYVGFGAMLDAVVAMAEQKLAVLNHRKRETCPLSDLVVGIQCGGSDAFSGVTANPVAGRAADLLVQAGATVMFSEVTEVRDAIHLLAPRAADEKVRGDLIREMQWYDSYLEKGGMNRNANPTPGNKKGGLANIVEKALGSIMKSGSSPIAEVLAPGERPTKKGLIYAATPASDFVCGTLQLASSINLQVFTTGRGTPYGLAMAPVVKVSTRNELYEQWPDLIDFNAGKVATGEATIDEAGKELFEYIIDIASGKKTVWADKWKLYNDMVLFNPAPIT